MPQVGDLITANATDSLSQAKSAQVMSQAKATQNSSTDPQLEKTAKAFESILLAKWLEEAQKSFATVPGDDPDKENQDPGADQYQNLALQSVAESITTHGGVGIAKMIMRQLAPRTPAVSQAADSTSLNPAGTKGGLPPQSTTKVPLGKDR